MNKKRIIFIAVISVVVILSGVGVYLVAKDVKSLDVDNKSETNSESTINYISNSENDYYIPLISEVDNKNDNPYDTENNPIPVQTNNLGEYNVTFPESSSILYDENNNAYETFTFTFTNNSESSACFEYCITDECYQKDIQLIALNDYSNKGNATTYIEPGESIEVSKTYKKIDNYAVTYVELSNGFNKIVHQYELSK